MRIALRFAELILKNIARRKKKKQSQNQKGHLVYMGPRNSAASKNYALKLKLGVLGITCRKHNKNFLRGKQKLSERKS